MKTLKVLDVTLRDGGCVNNFNFGSTYMEKILLAQEQAGIDVIELGYIDSKDGSPVGRTKYCDEKVIYKNFLKDKKQGITYVAMFDYGRFNPANLEEKNEKTIDGFRCAFHKKDKNSIIDTGRAIISKGYDFYIQPMITLRYSDTELLELIEMVNKEIPDAAGFYIVDTFGEMFPNDMNRMLNLIDHNLLPSMTIGFHSHNNLQLSYTNAMTLLQFPTNRNLMLDSSIMGMGKGAGNLNTELLLGHLNTYYGKSYKIYPILEVIDKVINQLKSENYWGYSIEYYLSSINHCTPSYAKHFYDKHMLPIDQVSELLSLIGEEKKISFDQDYAEKLYLEYNESKVVDDKVVVKDIKKAVCGRNCLLIAPGKSIKNNVEKIIKCKKDNDAISFGLNPTIDIDYDFYMITRKDIYDSSLLTGKKVIVPSNISKGGRGNVNVLNYHNWITVEDKIYDSSSVILINLLKKCEIRKLLLAGFDGFSIDINENYYDPDLRYPVNAEQVSLRNKWYKTFFQELRKENMEIEFITSSKYED